MTRRRATRLFKCLLVMTLSGELCRAQTANQTLPSALSPSVSFQVTAGKASDLEAFRACLSSNGTGLKCYLPPGTYEVTSPILVQRSNITLGAAKFGSVILRRQSNQDQVLYVGEQAPKPLRGIRIENLIIDGNSAQMKCPTGNCVDLWIKNTCATQASCEGKVTSHLGAYAATVHNTLVKDSPGHAVAFYTGAGTPANDIQFVNSRIDNARVTGLLVGGGADHKYQQCDNGVQAPWVPSHIMINNSSFSNSHTGAFGINISRFFTVRNSQFINNYWNPIPELPAGGTVFFDECTENTRILNNSFEGPYKTPRNATGGLELWGRHTLVQGNQIWGYPTDGIGANSVYDLKIVDNTVYNNNWFASVNPGWRAPGITIWNRIDHRLTQGISISRNRVYNKNGWPHQTYAVYLDRTDAKSDLIRDITITKDNAFTPNSISPFCIREGVTLSGSNQIAFPSRCEK